MSPVESNVSTLKLSVKTMRYPRKGELIKSITGRTLCVQQGVEGIISACVCKPVNLKESAYVEPFIYLFIDSDSNDLNIRMVVLRKKTLKMMICWQLRVEIVKSIHSKNITLSENGKSGTHTKLEDDANILGSNLADAITNYDSFLYKTKFFFGGNITLDAIGKPWSKLMVLNDVN